MCKPWAQIVKINYPTIPHFTPLLPSKSPSVCCLNMLKSSILHVRLLSSDIPHAVDKPNQSIRLQRPSYLLKSQYFTDMKLLAMQMTHDDPPILTMFDMKLTAMGRIHDDPPYIHHGSRVHEVRRPGSPATTSRRRRPAPEPQRPRNATRRLCRAVPCAAGARWRERRDPKRRKWREILGELRPVSWS